MIPCFTKYNVEVGLTLLHMEGIATLKARHYRFACRGKMRIVIYSGTIVNKNIF